MADSEIARILEDCYAALVDGREPDLDALCGERAELRARVERILNRERLVLERARSASDGKLLLPPHETYGETPSPDEAPRAPALGASFDDFEILEVLGSGGMGKVYRARQRSLQREVALKVLREEIAELGNSRARMTREALVTAALDHENIVPIYATGRAGDSIFLAMKLVRGKALDQQALPLDPKRSARIGVGVARGLHAAHEVGVLHRDVKPANVLLERDTPYLVDFGLARLAASTTQLTQGNAAPGTLAYMAPEMLRERAPTFDPRVDVYGLGATLYEVLSGHPPFESAVQVRLLREVLYESPPPLRLAARERDLETLVMRALEKSPSDRFESAAEMADELERYLRGEPIRSRPIGFGGRLLRQARLRPRATLGIAATAALLLALSAMLISSVLDARAVRTRELAQVAAAMERADMSAAREILERRRPHDHGEDLVALQRRFDEETATRDLMVVLNRIMVHTNPELAAPIADAVRARGGDARGRLAVATFDSLRGGVMHTPLLDDGLITTFPRTYAAVRAISAGAELTRALSACKLDGGPTDRFFAAHFALRARDARAASHELEGVPSDGPDGLAIQLARAVVHERLGQARAALLELGPAVAARRTRPVAMSMRARLSALLGYPNALELLREAKRLCAADPRPILRVFVAASELQILRDIADDRAFWAAWPKAEESLGHNESYWRLAVDCARESGELERAQEILQRGIARVGAPGRSLSLRAHAALVAWLQRDYCESPRPLSGSVLEAEEPGLRALLARAAELELESAKAHDSVLVGEMLLLQSRCARALGERRRAHLVLERACRELAFAEALAHSAYLTAFRVVNRHLAQTTDPDVLSAGPLDAACVVALERAQALMRSAKRGVPAALALVDLAEDAEFACAFHLGEMSLALRHAKRTLDARAPDAEPSPFERLAELTLEWGGLPLPVLHQDGADVEVLAARVLEGIETLRASALSNDERRAVIKRWGLHMRRARIPSWDAPIRALQAALRD